MPTRVAEPIRGWRSVESGGVELVDETHQVGHGVDDPGGPVGEPVDLVLDLMLHPDAWRARPLLYVSYLPLQELLHLPGQWASLQQLQEQLKSIRASLAELKQQLSGAK